jgi:hypothetical protein
MDVELIRIVRPARRPSIRRSKDYGAVGVLLQRALSAVAVKSQRSVLSHAGVAARVLVRDGHHAPRPPLRCFISPRLHHAVSRLLLNRIDFSGVKGYMSADSRNISKRLVEGPSGELNAIRSQQDIEVNFGLYTC